MYTFPKAKTLFTDYAIDQRYDPLGWRPTIPVSTYAEVQLTHFMQARPSIMINRVRNNLDINPMGGTHQPCDIIPRYPPPVHDAEYSRRGRVAKCLQHTHVDVINEIQQLIDEGDAHICWLKGPVGTDSY